jgi:hypothetical protein
VALALTAVAVALEVLVILQVVILEVPVAEQL